MTTGDFVVTDFLPDFLVPNTEEAHMVEAGLEWARVSVKTC